MQENELEDPILVNMGEYLLHTASKDKWRRIGTKRRTGILVPLFSVYSKNSLGIGEFADLKLLIDFCQKSNNSILQLLPLNELGLTHCPYDSLSSFALEPAYISFGLLDSAKKKSIQDKIAYLKKAFPTGKEKIDYKIKKEKLKLLWEIYLEETDQNIKELRSFSRENAYWLDDFSLFKALKDYHQGLPWYEWEERYKNRNPQDLQNFRKSHEREIIFQSWVQWQLYKQFKQVSSCAKARKVLLKGDLPILVSRDSADVWAHKEFFKLEFVAGAPPDMYSALGQRWSMPTYNWERIANDDYKYLKEKLTYVENFYDILRIDHVVGLFRIWSIPYNEPQENQGLNGFFEPQDERQWQRHARNILSVMLKSTKMLICAEDLGVIPRVCPKTLEELGIPGNDVQRWMKDWKIKHDFLEPEDYRLLSVAMLSTHDTTNWPGWYEFEAGTVDEALFIRKCAERRIDYEQIKNKLFDSMFSRHRRLRWLESIDSVDKLLNILGKPKSEVLDFREIYENSYQEKEKLWRHLKLAGPMREKFDTQILSAALKITLESRSIFCIQLLIDWLYLTDIFRGEPYQYRINTPGTISDTNWSLVLPISLEELLEHKVCQKIKEMLVASKRR